LKLSADSICVPLTTIYNLSLESGIVPTDWKTANVVPIFKEGDPSDPGNYRPISLTSQFMKIFEKCVNNELDSYLSENEIYCTEQSGFRKKHSTATALIDVSEHLLWNVNDRNFIGSVFIDLKKAFDTVNHSILLHKMERYGIQGSELAWFKSYLSNRNQYVTCNGAMSNLLPVTMGVPQGSILGPILFNLYINDLPSCVKSSKIVLYADDTALFFSHKSPNCIENTLNEDLNELSKWLKQNKLTLNVGKCKSILFGSQKMFQIYDPVISISINGEKIEDVASYKYLGMYLDKNVNFSINNEKL